MKIELLIDDKQGNVFNISDLVEEITWKTKRKDSPGTLEVTLLEDKQVTTVMYFMDMYLRMVEIVDQKLKLQLMTN